MENFKFKYLAFCWIVLIANSARFPFLFHQDSTESLSLEVSVLTQPALSFLECEVIPVAPARS